MMRTDVRRIADANESYFPQVARTISVDFLVDTFACDLRPVSARMPSQSERVNCPCFCRSLSQPHRPTSGLDRALVDAVANGLKAIVQSA